MSFRLKIKTDAYLNVIIPISTKDYQSMIKDSKELLKIKCGILAIHLLIFFLFTIMSIFIFYDLSNEIIDMAINKDKEYIMGYVKTKLLLVYSLFAAINVIFLLNNISFFTKKKKSIK